MTGKPAILTGRVVIGAGRGIGSIPTETEKQRARFE